VGREVARFRRHPESRQRLFRAVFEQRVRQLSLEPANDVSVSVCTRVVDWELAELQDSDWVVGVFAQDEARAHPHNVLWWHEIVNDEIAGIPIAITHCPLTFSTLAHDPLQFLEGHRARLGVSGLLFNSNLVFYDATDDTLYSQLLGIGTKGPSLNAEAPRVPVYEMSWAAWPACGDGGVCDPGTFCVATQGAACLRLPPPGEPCPDGCRRTSTCYLCTTRACGHVPEGLWVLVAEDDDPFGLAAPYGGPNR
jgi:Protein of unknown function (DUF3179)